MTKNRKLIIGLAVSSMLCFSSISCSHANQNIKDIDTISKITTTFEINNENEDESLIQPLSKIYEAESREISGKTFTHVTMELTSEFKYGKVFYSNNSSSTAHVSVTQSGKSKPIAEFDVSLWDGKGKIWTKSGIGSKTYKINVSTVGGGENLNGILSVAKSDIENELK